jgi:hypothetical protein
MADLRAVSEAGHMLIQQRVFGDLREWVCQTPVWRLP